MMGTHLSRSYRRGDRFGVKIVALGQNKTMGRQRRTVLLWENLSLCHQKFGRFRANYIQPSIQVNYNRNKATED